MINLFNQDNFIGGLNTRLEASKLPVGQYSLLINGRVTKNTVAPTKKHLKLETIEGTKQGLYALGSYLVLFIAGNAYWRNTASSSAAWALIPGWTALDASVSRIYAELVPVSYFQGSIDFSSSGDPQNVVITFPGIPAQTQSYLYVTDGINQGRIIAANGSWREVGTYGSWAITNPEYTPVGVLPTKAGQKLFLVDAATKTKIYNSVSGRFLDFVIRRAQDGDKDGTAETTFKSVDFNEITALRELPESGLFAGTLYSSYAIYPDYNTLLFAEPALREQRLFPTGPVNERSFADLNGDLAFITQTGIQSFNAVLQTQSESNNSPLGALISSILVTPQTNTCAINFDVEALFAVNTVYGYGVLVYDNTLEKFISLDLTFGQVKDFAVTKYAGSQRLFFLDSRDDVYEAYASTEYATCRIYLGDYGTYDPESGQQLAGKQHKVSAVRLQFGNVKSDFDAQVSLYVDRAFVKSEVRAITAENDYPEIAPYPLPYPATRNAYPADFKFDPSKLGWKTGFWLEWQGAAELLSVTAQGEVVTQDSFSVLIPQTNVSKKVVLFTDSKFESVVADVGAWTLQTGLEVGAYYSIVGKCHTGFKLVEDAIFRAPGSEVNILGRLVKCGQVKTIWDQIIDENPELIVGAGDHAYNSGTQNEVKQILTLFEAKNLSKIYLAAGNHDQDTNLGQYFFGIRATPRMFVKSFGNTDFFILNSGYNTAGALIEPLGNTESSNQALWLKEQLENSTAKFKIAVFHHPPYTEDVSYYPGFTNLRWPFAAWGIDMVVSGHAHLYQRFSVDNIPYIVLPSATYDADVRAAKTDITSTAVLRSSVAGYARLRIDNYTILVEVLDKSGNMVDAFGIYD